MGLQEESVAWYARPGDQLEGGAVSFDDLDLISGWRYNATLQLRTPLASSNQEPRLGVSSFCVHPAGVHLYKPQK